MEFPRLVYKNHGPHQRPGGTYDHALVEDQADMNAALKAGWYASLPEALDAQKGEALGQGDAGDDAPPTREELEAKATELGLAFSPNIGDKKLAERIQAALDAQKGEA